MKRPVLAFEGRRSMHDASTSLEFGINYLMYAMTH